MNIYRPFQFKKKHLLSDTRPVKIKKVKFWTEYYIKETKSRTSLKTELKLGINITIIYHINLNSNLDLQEFLTAQVLLRKVGKYSKQNCISF